MMCFIRKIKSFISINLLVLFLLGFWTNNAYGYPGGPTQPEATGFSAINHTEMVDKFTGKFSYNIPIMDVGGYPINLVYNADVNSETEASWVGLGWSLNTGSINRMKRGLPDDFKGDIIKREINRKDLYKVSVTMGPGVQLFNLLNASLKYGVYYKSNVGWGTDAGFALGLSYKGLGLNFTRESNDEDGVTSSLGGSYSIGKSYSAGGFPSNIGLGISWGESSNSRVGLMQRSWGVALTNKFENALGTSLTASGSYQDKTTFIAPTYIPTIETPFHTWSGTLSLKAGGDILGGDVNGTLTGYYMRQKIAEENKRLSNKSYGFIHAKQGAKDPGGLMDFNREKDAPYHARIPNLSVPQNTYDVFVINQHSGGGQFRAYRNSLGIVKDPYSQTTEDDYKLSLEAHFGLLVEVGGDFGSINSKTLYTGKDNGTSLGPILPVGELTNIDHNSKIENNPVQEEFYFKKIGELEEVDPNYNAVLGWENPINLSLSNCFNPSTSFRGNSFENKFTQPVSKFYSKELTESERPNIRNTFIGYKDFTLKSKTSLDKNIVNYSNVEIGTTQDPKYLEAQVLNNPSGIEHQIAEFNVTNEDGSQYNYGLPLYNNIEENVTFTAQASKPRDENGLVEYNHGHDNTLSNSGGIDGYYNKEITPKYAHSWLLTNIVSSDYLDMTNDGITDDDRGTAIKFNYTKTGNYTWRNPIAPDLKSSNKTAKATFYEGSEYYNNDNRGIYSYGEREEWYNHSIESKTMIVFFLTKNRTDAYPMKADGDLDQSGTKRKYLDRIILYSKAEISKILKSNGNAKMSDIMAQAIPIKTVVFDYNYSLCKNYPSNIDHYNNQNSNNNGKLTLVGLRFFSGKNQTPLTYKFDYGNTLDDNPNYGSTNYDRWGNYKKNKTDNNLFASGLNIENSKFPYAVQNKQRADQNSKAWLLKAIKLPSGGEIKVNYESNDYCYVQNKRAANMYKIVGVANTSSANFSGKNKLYEDNGSFNNYLFFETSIDQSVPMNNDKVKELFFEDLSNKEFKDVLFYKTVVELGNGKNEYMPGYGIIKGIGLSSYKSNGKHVVWVKLADIKGYGAIPVNAWQYIRDNIPILAYEGYPEMDFNILKIAGRLVSNLKKIVTGQEKFEIQAVRRRLGQKINIQGKSYARALIPDMNKYGGGARVSKISLTDNWDVLVNPSNATNIKTPQRAEYTIDYEYATQDKTGKTISSGVATYEPLMGGEENPWRLPVFYQGTTSDQGGFLGLSPEGPATNYSLERPFGESLFPNASIGYSQVKIATNKTKSSPPFFTGNGYKEYEYYTAKDFPLSADNTYLDNNNTRHEQSDQGFSLKLILGGTTSTWDRRAASQGYSVVLNDMHGKPKTEKLYKHGGALFSSSTFLYRSVDNIPTLGLNGVITNKSLSENMDITIDVRTHVTNVSSSLYQPGGGYAGIPPFGALWPMMPPPTFTKDEKFLKLYSTSKLIHKNHVLDKVIVKKDNAIYTTENLVWDPKTLEPLITKTNNEFNQSLFSYELPAYFAYPKLGHKYKNQGIELLLNTGAGNNFSLTDGQVIGFNKFLQSGDNLLLEGSSTSHLLFVSKVKDKVNLIKNDGTVFIPAAGNYKLIVYNSSYRNRLKEDAMSIESFENPISGNWLKQSLNNVVNGNSTELFESWKPILKTNLKRSGNTPNCITSWTGNLYTNGLAENWKSRKTYSLSGIRKGKTGIAGTSNISNDGTSLSGVNLFYIQNGNGFTKNPNIELWDNKSEITLYNENGSQAEAMTKISKYESGLKNYTSQFTYLNTGTNQGNNGTIETGEVDRNWYVSNSKISTQAIGCYHSAWAVSPWSNARWISFNSVGDQMGNFPSGYINTFTTNVYIPRDIVSPNSFKFKMQFYADDGVSDVKLNGVSLPITGYQHFSSPVCSPCYGSISSGQTAEVELTGFNYGNNTLQVIVPNYVTYLSLMAQLKHGEEIIAQSCCLDEITYSSTKAGFNRSVPLITASNAQHKEIDFCSFEENNFDLSKTAPAQDLYGGMIPKLSPLQLNSDKNNVHTGSYSLKVLNNSDFKCEFKLCDDANKNFVNQFNLERNKEYLISFWVKTDENLSTTNPNLLAINQYDASYNPIGSISTGAILKTEKIEGWQLYEQRFSLDNASVDKVELSFKGSSNSSVRYFDDVRIIPSKAMVKSYVYDEKNLRLIGELDDQHFTTFYDYDEDGNLIRLRKETEKGIVTLKEMNINFQKNN